MSQPVDLDKVEWLREKLRSWGMYRDHFDEVGRLTWHGWEALPIDEMTDEQIVEAARKIANNEPGWWPEKEIA